MSLKKRLFLILTAAGIILAVFFHFSINMTIVADLDRQKSIVVQRLEQKLRAVTGYEKKNISTFAAAWAEWEGMAAYIRNPTPQFEKEFLEDSTLMSHMLNIILIRDPSGKTIYYKLFHNHLEHGPPGEWNIRAALTAVNREAGQAQHPITGIVKSVYGPLVVTAMPVKPGARPGFSGNGYGTLLIGRFIDKKRLEKASLHLNQEFQLVNFKEAELFQFYLSRMQGKNFRYLEESRRITALLLVNDVFSAPAMILKAELPMKQFWVAQKHTLSYIVFTILSIFFLGALLYYFIEKYINKRIARISGQMKIETGRKDTPVQIRPDGFRDEISSLIRGINEMLDKIEADKVSKNHMEQRLVTSEKLVSIGRLSASIAHEINNPALAISNCLQALKKTCKQCRGNDYNLHRKAITLSETEINRIRNIVSNLLDYHRLDVEEFSQVNLNEVILQSLEILRWSNKLGSIKIVTGKRRNLYCWGSHGKLKQVFINFILNSVEANTDNNGELRIEIRPAGDGDFLEVHFADNGPGLEDNIKERLFEPFVTTKNEKGAGLGLYISYKIIENHGGEIILDRSHTGGAYFIIRLPAVQEGENPPPDPQRENASTRDAPSNQGAHFS